MVGVVKEDGTEEDGWKPPLGALISRGGEVFQDLGVGAEGEVLWKNPRAAATRPPADPRTGTTTRPSPKEEEVREGGGEVFSVVLVEEDVGLPVPVEYGSIEE